MGKVLGRGFALFGGGGRTRVLLTLVLLQNPLEVLAEGATERELASRIKKELTNFNYALWFVRVPDTKPVLKI